MPPASLAIGAVGLAVVLGGAALSVRDLGASAPVDDSAAQRLAAAIDGRARERLAGATARARTLAELPVLGRAVSTDALTVADLTGAEVGFRLQPDERLEIGQLDLASRQVSSLLRLPASAAPTPGLDQPGARVVLQDGHLLAIQVIAVTPDERADQVSGTMAVSSTVDLTGLASGPAVLTAGATTLVLQDGALGDRVATIALASAPGISLRAPAVLPARKTATYLRGPGLAVLGLILLAAAAAVSRLSRKRPPLPDRPPLPLTPSSIDAIAAQLEPVPTLPPGRAPSTGMPSPTDGPHFGRYQTVRLLGSGGMADVYLARATGEAGFTRQVALKVLHPQMARRADAVNYFLDEARLAARLLHPNIVQVLDLGKAGDDYYIAMELVDGPDLDSVMRALRQRREYMPLAIALAILRKICDGLHVAHTATDDHGAPLSIIHRDVKTANVLLSRQGEIKVGDFGIARAATSIRTTVVGETRGTAEFMAPEQRMGQAIDIRADVYAVAAVAYEIVTSQPINLDLAALAHKGIAGWPHLPAPSSLRPDLPFELDRLILGALAFEPGNRPASCAVLEEQLAALVRTYGLTVSGKELASWLHATVPVTRYDAATAAAAS